MDRSLKTLLESWSMELLARTNRVRALIGDAHWLSDGMHKERLVQAFVAARLPATLSADHGFVLDLAADECSPEIDVFVRDAAHSTPLLDESGITICHPLSVLAYCEVKSNFAAGSLASALQLIATTQKLICKSVDDARVWRAVCFMGCSESRTNQSYLDTISAQLAQACDSLGNRGENCCRYLPTAIMCLERFCAFIGPGSQGTRGRVRFFAAEQLSFAVGLADMLAHIYAHSGMHKFNPLDEAIEQIVRLSPDVREF